MNDTAPARTALISAASLTDRTVEVRLPIGCSPENLNLEPILGAPVDVTGFTHDPSTGLLQLTHTGTTLGGVYQVTHPDLGTSEPFLALGHVPTFTTRALDGKTLEVEFSDHVLPEELYPGGVGDPASYRLDTAYPVKPWVRRVTHTSPSTVRLDVGGMTTTSYTLTVAPSTFLRWTSTGRHTHAPVLSRLTPGCNVRLDALVQAREPGTVSLSDGQESLGVSFEDGRRVGLTVGGVTTHVSFGWRGRAVSVSILRNQRAGFVTLLLDGVPALTRSLSSPVGHDPEPKGVSWTFPDSTLRDLKVAATNTIFSGSWNFTHDKAYAFFGDGSEVTRPVIVTRRGPLVKAWGDTTPATVEDVEVRVNGVAVSVASVNPYLGLIFPTVPIPLTPAGTTTVEVDYAWFPNPAMNFAGLNTLGIVLNKWDLPRGLQGTPPVSPLPPGHPGVPDSQRFPMGFLLGPPTARPQPVQIGHRYIGFEKAYSALLNSPTTLLLNQDPRRTSPQDASLSFPDVSVSYEGDVTPPDADPVWELVGTDTGNVGTGDDLGRYVLIGGGYYTRFEDFSLPSVCTVAVRVTVPTYEKDGVFSGVGFGFHDDSYLYLIGFLEVNLRRHVGLLLNPMRPMDVESWDIAMAFDLSVTGTDTFTTTDSVFFEQVSRSVTGGAGLVFQILEGSQAGVYTVADCGVLLSEHGVDTATVTVTTDFPADYTLEDNRDATGYVEIDWSTQEYTYRLLGDTRTHRAALYVGGTLSGRVLLNSAVPAYPAATSLILSTDREGEVFWGSVSQEGNPPDTSVWALVRYGLAYLSGTTRFTGIVAAAGMTVAPDDPTMGHPWFVTEDFGSGTVGGGVLLLKSNTAPPASSPTMDTSFGYARLEPFITPRVMVDVDAVFLVDTGTLGAGDACVEVRNGERTALLATLLYTEGAPGSTPFRRLVALPPPLTITALRDPTEDGWTYTDTPTGEGVTVEVQENRVVFTQVAGTTGVYTQDLTTTTDSTGSRIFEATLTVTSASGLVTASGPRFGGRFDVGGRDVQVALTDSAPARVRLLSSGASIASYAFDWGDGLPHTYRVLCDVVGATVTLVVDDVVLGVSAAGLFGAVGNPLRASFGIEGATSACVTSWASMSASVLPAASVKRTLGVLTGDDTSIDGWEIPRTDASPDANSAESAVPEEMDWRSAVQVRVRLDPGWGVTVFRPDLAPPPYYTGDNATPYTEPSAGWINVETARIPSIADSEHQFGRIAFGSLTPYSVTQQRWSDVRYHAWVPGTEVVLAPQYMVLNRYNVVNSGELARDTTLEVLAIESIDSSRISLRAGGVSAARVYTVIVGGSTVLPSTEWVFDADAQLITLNEPLDTEHEVVTVSFVAGRPVTLTYLCAQPLLQSVTLLNTGTPPVPLSQIGAATRTEVPGGIVTDPEGSGDTIDDAGFSKVTFTDDPAYLYEALEFCTVDDGGVTWGLSTLWDGPAPEVGWIELALSGTQFSDSPSQEGGPGRWGTSPSLRDSVGNWSQASILTASGGGRGGGVLGPGTAILYPSYPAIRGTEGKGMGAINRSLTMRITYSSPSSPLEDDLDFVNMVTDNVPPSAVWGVEPNPDGVPGVAGHGACIAELSDAVSTTYSRIGPWGGERALGLRSYLYGGSFAPTSGVGLTLSGGASLGAGPTVTVVNVVSAN